MKNRKKFAVTGGIGSGKSLATKTLKTAGYYTLSADDIVSELYEKTEVRKILKNIFPTAIGQGPDYVIDRKAVSSIAFADKKKHAELTRVVTPLVMEEIEKRTKNFDGVTIVEVPLLFECGYENLFDGVIVITRPLEERIKSVMARSNLSREQVLARINNQVDYFAIDLNPYIVIQNDGDVETFKENILSAVKNLTE